MTGRVIRFPIADPLETALVAATELDREQLEQLQEQVLPLRSISPPKHLLTQSDSCATPKGEAAAGTVSLLGRTNQTQCAMRPGLKRPDSTEATRLRAMMTGARDVLSLHQHLPRETP